MRRLFTLLALALVATPLRAAEPAGPVTLERLLDRMVDLDWLARPPAEGERTVQFSSYDRASKLQDGKIVNPFANGDRGHYQRVDTRPDGTKEFVLAETEGPGYVSRIWSANPAGTLRIYVDGGTTPALEADFPAITSGKVAPFTPPYGAETSRGCNLYFPFPFAKSIKVVTSEGDQYFQVGVTYLPKGTPIESYSPALLERASAKREAVRKALVDPDHGRPDAGALTSFDVNLQPGQSETTDVQAPGPDGGVITWIRVKPTGDDLTTALARSLVTITCDDAGTPQVAVPLGDLFGSGPGVNVFATAPSSVAKDGTMTLRWPMPFARSARLSVTNGGGKPLSLVGEIGVAPLEGAEKALRFHARWKQEDDIPTRGGDGTKDWHALAAKGGPGRFVGLELNVFNPTAAWWGEGDEKVYVDGEAFPSTFGTGTEDYFGYAWCDPHPYTHPFHAQTRCDGPGNHGNTSNVRYQILDQIPWHESLAFDIEVWHWEAVKVQYASIAFFYAGAGATAEPAGVPDLSKRIVHSGEFKAHKEPGVLEAEKLKVFAVSAGTVPNQDMMGYGNKWSGGAHLWWVVREPKGELALELPVEKAGTYNIDAAFTKAPDYGTVQVAIDGHPLGDPIDLYSRGVVHTGQVRLGSTALSAGVHTLTLTLTGKNPKSTSYLVGMDWIKLTSVPLTPPTPGPR